MAIPHDASLWSARGMTEAFVVARWSEPTSEHPSMISRDGDAGRSQGHLFARRYRSLDGPYAGFAVVVPTPATLAAGSHALRDLVASLEFPRPLRASVYRYRIGSRPGIDYLFGPGPVSIYCVDVDPRVEQAWNDYYDTEHFPAVLAQDGCVGGTRGVHGSALLDELDDPDRRYLVLYEYADVAGAGGGDQRAVSEDRRQEYERWRRKGAPHTRRPLHLRGLPVERR
jgi:hypothetical protein